MKLSSLQNRNRSFYLNNMSDLLAVYIDMELKASRRNREDHNIICTRLISCLYVYLGMYFKRCSRSIIYRFSLIIKFPNVLFRTFHGAFVRYFDKDAIDVQKLSPHFKSDNNVSIQNLRI